VDFVLHFALFVQVLASSDKICFISVIWLRVKDSVIDLLTECKRRRKEANTRVTTSMAEANKALEEVLLGCTQGIDQVFSAFVLGVSREGWHCPELRLFVFTPNQRHYRNHPFGIEVALFKHPKPKFSDTALTQKESSICGPRISLFQRPFVLTQYCCNCIPTQDTSIGHLF